MKCHDNLNLRQKETEGQKAEVPTQGYIELHVLELKHH